MKSSSKASASTARWWLVAAGACVVIGAVVLWIATGSHDGPKPSTDEGQGRPFGAYRPALAQRWRGSAAAGSADTLPPELEARLQAATHVSTVPAPRPPGAPPLPPPPTTPLSPEAEVQRQQALAGWRQQVQRLLDECVARPAAERKPTTLNVMLAPPPAGNELAAQQLVPVAVSLPPQELRRLWRDTDPDALQGCLERVRTLALSVPAAPSAPARVLPPSMEPLLVQL